MKTKVRRSKSSRLSSVALFAFAGMAIGSMVLAGQQLAMSVRFADMLYLTKKLKPGDPEGPRLVAQFAEKTRDIVDGGYCRSDIVNAGLGFVLADLDLRNSAEDFDAWAASMARAERYIKHALSCSPADGNLWVRLAMVRWAAGENPQEIAELLQQSTRLSPAEIDAFRARFILWRKVSKATLDLASDAVDRDLRTLLLYVDRQTIREILASSGENLKPRITAILKFVPPERIEVLKKAKIDLSAFL